MSKSILKRRSSSVSDSANHNHHQTKRRRSSSQQRKASNLNQHQQSARSAPEQSKTFYEIGSNILKKFVPSMFSNTPQEIFEIHPGGSLDMLESYNKPPSPSSRIPNGHSAGSSSAHPIDVSELDDDAEIPFSSKPKNSGRSVSPKKLETNGIAGPSRQMKPLSPDLSPNLFPETFSQVVSQSQLPTPPDSQDVKKTEKGSSSTKKLLLPDLKQLDQHPPTPPDSQKAGTIPRSGLMKYTFEYNADKRAGPSSLSKQPSRPDVHVDVDSTPRPKKKGWEKRSVSPSESVTSSSSSVQYRRRKKSSNLRSPEKIKEIENSFTLRWVTNLESDEKVKADPKLSRAVESVKNLFVGRSISNPQEIVQRTLTHAGFNDKSTYAKMLMSHQPRFTTIDDKITSTKTTYDPVKKRQQGRDARDQSQRLPVFDLDRVYQTIAEIQDEESRKEEEIKEKLKAKKPKVPKLLNPEQEAQVTAHLKDPAFKSRVSTAECEAKSIQRLKNGTWLDDEIMNFYIALMDERAKEKGNLKLHAFNSFFYQRLSEKGYSAVKRWTKKIDLFSKDLVIFPVNIGNMHWTACAINLKEKRIEYYDSMGDFGAHRNGIFRRVRGYLNDEHKERKKTPFDFEGWTEEFNDNTPQQDNGSDCGVFSCQTLEMITRGRDLKNQPFEFTSENMPFFRRLMVWEIANRKLEKRTWGSPAL
ncbi:hypothetical protein I302_103653 [Kwoniella bestiolae CBS 10118]|uniref:Ubiquitin-like protease family profile domain-containing protein n=1 Tax=Kwoniella bestiolae CBS 10118 TaxID=1296100 RepID=A0A1B9G928_9TREE|nr:hypothetical protein I302_02358 [Kwoniella bestiolae CBS 10118]OCF27516.1 hypothetical protein I302_02358 [Kwoniella bestiolae CBS 10118]